MNAHDPLPATTDPSRRPVGPSPPFIEAPASPNRPAKIQPWHLERLAVIYVRQSSRYQVINNRESAEVQANLREVAVAWGWPASRVVVIDEDQARSATSAEGRAGFQWLLTEVNLNHVGMILGFQVSRLARANSDWYHLLERCAIFHTLLADLDGLYDPTAYNDRLLLGLKGTMSEAELHFLGQRLVEARRNKARKGEQFVSAPIGYVRSACGNHLELDPDEQVQHVVRLIFDKFDELGSAGAVLRYLVRHEIKLGFRVPSGPDAGQLRWRPAIRPTLNRILRHPYYAGCYVYGFTRRDPRRKKPGHPASGIVQVPRLQWDVMIPGAIPAYITWERYLANQRRLTSNRSLPTTPGAPRSGPSLLSGLVYCGRCGQRMRVAYHTAGTPAYYICNIASVERAEPMCQSLAGAPLEALVTDEVLRALEPAGLELSARAIADLEREQQRLDRHWRQRLERAGIEADRAARKYHAVEPENRLVARELERRWEQALRERRELEEQYDRFLADRPREPTAADRRRIEALAADVPGLWHDPAATVPERQQVVRYLVERITVAVRGRSEWVDVTMRWAGGIESRHEIRRPVQRYQQLSNYDLLCDRVVELRRSGATTEEIAERLDDEGFRPPRGPDRFNRHVVNQFLRRQGLLGPEATRRIDPEDLRPGEWRLGDLARELGMPAITLRHWHYHGWVEARKSSPVGGCWILWADEAELERLRRLRAWHRGGHDLERPLELTTPRLRESHDSRPGGEDAPPSSRNSLSGEGRAHD
jgi:DNA invertase Pin-like site-specific DNA recombinase